eukprot:scaffold26546_cov60-Phaeocystis_antarctica.AAC.2
MGCPFFQTSSGKLRRASSKRSATDEPTRHTNGGPQRDEGAPQPPGRWDGGGRRAGRRDDALAARRRDTLAKPQLADPACQSAKRSFLIFYEEWACPCGVPEVCRGHVGNDILATAEEADAVAQGHVAVLRKADKYCDLFSSRFAHGGLFAAKCGGAGDCDVEMHVWVQAEGEEVEWPSAAFFEQQEEDDDDEEVPIIEEDVDPSSHSSSTRCSAQARRSRRSPHPVSRVGVCVSLGGARLSVDIECGRMRGGASLGCCLSVSRHSALKHETTRGLAFVDSGCLSHRRAFSLRHTSRYTVREPHGLPHRLPYVPAAAADSLRAKRLAAEKVIDSGHRGETPVIVAETQLRGYRSPSDQAAPRRLRRSSCGDLTASAVTSQKIKLPPIKLRSISHENIFHKNDLSAAAAADKELLSMCHRGVFLLQIESSSSGNHSGA